MTPQEAFDKAVYGVIAQGRPSAKIDEQGRLRCLYRSPDGCKCAAGHVLTCEDDLAAADETYGWNCKSVAAMARDAGTDAVLLVHLQCAHDGAAELSYIDMDEAFDCEEFLKEFRRRANKVAEFHGLRGVE